MKSPLYDSMPIAIRLCAIFAFAACLTPAALGQDGNLLTTIAAPPPIKSISRDERARLSTAGDVKERTLLSIQLAEGHLRHVEEATFTRSYDPASAALGRYQAIMEDALKYLVGANSDSKKMRDLFKRLEMTLRLHIMRIEAVRRDTPFEHAVNIKAALEDVRQTRTQALNAFYSDTVINEVLQENAEPSGDKPSTKSTSSGTPKKQL